MLSRFRGPLFAAATVFTVLCAVAVAPSAPAWALDAAQASATPSPTPAPDATPKPGGIDPCALLGAPDVASALHTTVHNLAHPHRPTADECLWAATSRMQGVVPPQVLFGLQIAQSKPACRGINCLWMAHSITSSLGVNLPGSQLFDHAMSTAGEVQYITGLGEKAGWANGLLTVLQNNVLYKVQIGGLATSQLALDASELIARHALNRAQTPPTAPPSPAH
jgi:hypothetical protein